jgi:hypothetical protein
VSVLAPCLMVQGTGASERYDWLADIVAPSCDLGVIGKLVGLNLRQVAP